MSTSLSGERVGNERLRAQISRKGMSLLELATDVEVDPKTVERWIQQGRLPHPRHRRRTSAVLGVSEAYLWPEITNNVRTERFSRAEVVDFYPHRGAVPTELWRELLSRAERHVDILVYAGLFLVDANPDLAQLLSSRVGAGLKARLAYGNAESAVMRARGDEERIGPDLAARTRIALAGLEHMVDCPGVEIRIHETTLYNSIYRFDDQMLVNAHILGSPAALNPVIHLRRVDGGQLFDRYLASFDRAWQQTHPLAGGSEP